MLLELILALCLQHDNAKGYVQFSGLGLRWYFQTDEVMTRVGHNWYVFERGLLCFYEVIAERRRLTLTQSFSQINVPVLCDQVIITKCDY